MAKTTHSLKMIFGTDQEDKTLTKTFSGYNTELADDAILSVASTLATNAIFADDDNGAIASVKKVQVLDTTTRDILPAQATE